MLLTVLLTLAALDPVVLVVDDRCGGVEAVVDGVVGRVGAEAVVVSSPRVITVRFDGDVAPIVADVIFDVDGARVGARRLGPFRDCAAAIEAVALTASLVIDPLGTPATPIVVDEPAPPDAPTVSDAPVPVSVPVGVPEQRPPSMPRRRPRVAPLVAGGGAGVGVVSGLAPGVGPTVLGRLRIDLGEVPFVIAAGGRLDLPDVLVLDGNHRIESTAAAFFVDGCYRQNVAADVVVDACVVGEAGALRAEGIGFDVPTPVTAQVMGVGLAVQVRAALWSGLGVFARGLVDAPLVGARLVDARGDVLWESPRVGGLFVVGVDGLGLAGGSG